MNLAKARDYFSAYYEGSLDRGLKQSFEVRLKEDAQLQAEYKAFERTMKSLEAFGRIEVEPPADLHEKIASRVDRAIWEQKREKSNGFSLTWLRGLGLVGAVAIVGVVAFGVKSHVATSPAGIIGADGATSAHFVFAGQGKVVTLSYAPVNHETIVMKNASGMILKSLPLDHAGLVNYPIQNAGDGAYLVDVETTDQSGPASFVALPGRLTDQTTTGKGSVTDLALALAAHYQHPVVVQAGDAVQEDTSWGFNGADPMAAANAAVRSLNLVVSEDTNNGLISITKS